MLLILLSEQRFREKIMSKIRIMSRKNRLIFAAPS